MFLQFTHKQEIVGAKPYCYRRALCSRSRGVTACKLSVNAVLPYLCPSYRGNHRGYRRLTTVKTSEGLSVGYAVVLQRSHSPHFTHCTIHHRHFYPR